MIAWSIQILTAAAATCVLASLVPEIWQNARRPERAKGQSPERAWLYLTGQLLWTARGVLSNDWTFVGVTLSGAFLGGVLLYQIHAARKS